MSRMLRLAAGLTCALLVGCEGARREVQVPAEETAAAPTIRIGVPEAFLVRFEKVSGTGFSREGWELEVLQMGGDIRIRGSVRRQGSAVPVFRPMDAAEFAEFWSWIEAYPLDGFQVKTDPALPEPGWRKRLKFDAVIGTDERLLCDNEWTRPAVDAPWLAEIEERLHAMVIELAEQELAAPDTTETAEDASEAMQRALEAIGETPGSTAEPPGGD
ncbi:MAG: hypothetical protein ACT4PE_03100 [Candidatus Eiseniibacteriota bacterium]